jgi:hypothetical protein
MFLSQAGQLSRGLDVFAALVAEQELEGNAILGSMRSMGESIPGNRWKSNAKPRPLSVA